MQRQFLYLAGRLAGPFIVSALCMTGVVWLTQSLRFVDMIVNHGLALSTFFTLTLLMTPSLLALTMPLALFISLLLVYHRLIADSELVVLRATGSSNLRLSAPALALASMVALAVLAINLYFMPAGLRMFKDRQFEIRHSLASLLLQEGVFNTPVDGLTVFVRERASDGELRGILVHDDREPESAPVTVTAERGALLNTADHPRFVLENGNRQQVERDSDRLSVLYFESYAFDFAPQTGLLPGRIRKPRERYLGELLRPEEEVSAHRRAEFLAEAWQRVSSPFHAVILALIACAALLSGDFNRRGQVRRAFAGGAVGVVFLSASLGVQNMIAVIPQLAVVHGLVLVLCGVAAATILLLERKRRWTFVPAPFG